MPNLDKKLNMFSSGQLIFAALFVIGFTSLIILMYRKDAKGHKIHFCGKFFVREPLFTIDVPIEESFETMIALPRRALAAII